MTRIIINDDTYFLAVILMSILVPTNVLLPAKDGCLLNFEVKCSGYS